MDSEWRKDKLKTIVEINPYRRLSKGVAAKHVAMDDIKPFTKFINKYEVRDNRGGVKFQNGDTLMARITPCLENGKTSFCNILEDGEAATGSTEFIVLAEKAGITDKHFIYYLAISQEFRNIAIKSMSGTSGRQRVQVEALENTYINLPPFTTQKRIAEILSSLDDKIELNRQTNLTLEAIAKAIFTSWFIDFDPVRAKIEGRESYGKNAETAALFPDKLEYMSFGEIPKGWDIKNLSDVIEINPHRSLSKGRSAPYLEMSNMPTSSARALSWEYRNFSSGMKFVNGDVLLARITPCLENGKTAYVDFLADGQVGWGSTEYIVFYSKPPLPKEYAYFLARSEELRSHAIQNMTGTSGRQRVPAECFNFYQIVVPSDKVAVKFGEVVRPFMLAMKQYDEESQTLASIRDALLPKLLSGEIKIKDAEKLVEAHV